MSGRKDMKSDSTAKWDNADWIWRMEALPNPIETNLHGGSGGSQTKQRKTLGPHFGRAAIR